MDERPHRTTPRTAARLLAAALALAAGVATTAACAGVAAAETASVHLAAKRASLTVAPGVKMRAWTFGGKIPGPVIRATEGDTVEITLRNSDSEMAHSIDLHAAQISPQAGFADVLPGQKRTFSFVARRPGVFLYHCGTSPVLQHIGMGMYGAIVVDPIGGRTPAREKVIVQSEFYGPVEDHWIRPTYRAMQTQDPTFTAFNGRAFRYRDNPMTAEVGEPLRLYVVDAGPTLDSNFHVVGDIFDTVEPDGNPLNAMTGVSTYGIPAGGGAMFELTFDQAGTYPFVTHAFRWADTGALGLIEAG
jgi:nitrite reductase (NO-forming)